MVGGVVGLSASWEVPPSHALVLCVQGGLWPGAVGWWAVVVVVVGEVLGLLVLVVVVVVVVAGAPLAVLVVVGLVVLGLVAVVVLCVRDQDPPAFRWGLGAGHRLKPFGLRRLVDSGGGFRAWLDGDRGRGVPRPLGRSGRRWWWFVGGGWSGAWRWGCGRGIEGVVLLGRLRGDGSPWGQGDSGCCGCGVLVWVWVMVGVRAGVFLVLIPSAFCNFIELCGVVWVVLVMLLVVVVVVVLLRAVLSFGLLFLFGVELGPGVPFEVAEDLVSQV